MDSQVAVLVINALVLQQGSIFSFSNAFPYHCSLRGYEHKYTD